MLRKGYLIPRPTRCFLDPSYAFATFWLLQMVVYLIQLESLSDRGVRARSLESAIPSP